MKKIVLLRIMKETKLSFCIHITLYMMAIVRSSFKNEYIRLSDIEIMNASFGSSGSFVSIVRSKFIVHNACIGRRSNFRSNPTPIHGTVQKS